MKKYLLIIMIVMSLFLISSVTAHENHTDNGDVCYPKDIPIEYRDLNSPYHYSIVGGYPIPNTVKEFNLTEKINVTTTAGPINYENNKTNPNLKLFMVNRTIDGNGTLLIETNPNATGQVYLSFLKTPLNLTNGKTSYDFHNLDKRSYYFDLFYTGDEKFSHCRYIDLIFSMPAFSTKIVAKNDNIVMYYKNGTKFVATLYDDANRPLVNRNIKLLINNVAYYRSTNSNGTFSINLNLAPGNYDIKVIYHGQKDVINCSEKLCNLTIIPTLVNDNLVKFYQNDTQYKIQLLDSQGKIMSNKKVRLNINGVFYNRTTDTDGFAKLNINLAPGNYIVTAENIEDGCRVSNNITVLPTIVTNDLVKLFKNDSQFSVKLLKKDGSSLANAKLIMNIHGVLYNRTTDADGFAKLNINLAPGNYIITTHNIEDGCIISNNIEVKDYLYAFDMVKYYKNASRYSVKLVDENYNPVSGEVVEIDINGVKYTRTTNDKGIASLAINLMPGDYKVTAKSLNKDLTCTNNIKILPTLYLYENGNVSRDNFAIKGKNNFSVLLLDGNGNPLANQTVVYDVCNTKVDVKTDDYGIAKFPTEKIVKYIPYNNYKTTKLDVKVGYDNQIVSGSTYFDFNGNNMIVIPVGENL